MALSSAALTTLAKVKGVLGITDASQDDRLEALIEAASASAAIYCGREFHRVDGIAERVPGYSSMFLRVKRTPILAVDSVEYNDTEIEASSYEIDSAELGFLYNYSGWIHTAATVGLTSFSRLPGTERKRYTVNYDGGYVTPNQVDLGDFPTRTLPYDLEDAVCRMATESYQSQTRDSSIAAEKVLTGAVTYRTDSMRISSQVSQVLDLYTVAVIA